MFKLTDSTKETINTLFLTNKTNPLSTTLDKIPALFVFITSIMLFVYLAVRLPEDSGKDWA
jgi:hypothetical protein